MPSPSTVERIYSQVYGSYRVAVLTRVSSTQRRLEIHEPTSLRDLLVRIIEIVDAADPEFVSRLLEIDDRQQQQSKRRSRRYFAESPDLLYIGNPALTHYSAPVSGIWFATNIGCSEASTMMGEIRRASRVPFERWSVLGIDGQRQALGVNPVQWPAGVTTTKNGVSAGM